MVVSVMAGPSMLKHSLFLLQQLTECGIRMFCNCVVSVAATYIFFNRQTVDHLRGSRLYEHIQGRRQGGALGHGPLGRRSRPLRLFGALQSRMFYREKENVDGVRPQAPSNDGKFLRKVPSMTTVGRSPWVKWRPPSPCPPPLSRFFKYSADHIAIFGITDARVAHNMLSMQHTDFPTS